MIDRDAVLKIITDEIDNCEKKLGTEKLIVDKIDVVALKEVYNKILKLEDSSENGE
jgi:hypothetical protein